MRKSASEFSTVGENKNNDKQVKPGPLLPKAITASASFFCQALGVTSGHLYLLVLLRARLGWRRGARQISIQKAIPGAEASQLYRLSS